MIFVVKESSTDFIEKNARNSTNCIENNASKAILFMESYWKRCKQRNPAYPPNECLSAHIACVVAFSVLRCLCGCFCIRSVAPDAVFILWLSEPDSFEWLGLSPKQSVFPFLEYWERPCCWEWIERCIVFGHMLVYGLPCIVSQWAAALEFCMHCHTCSVGPCPCNELKGFHSLLSKLETLSNMEKPSNDLLDTWFCMCSCGRI